MHSLTRRANRLGRYGTLTLLIMSLTMLAAGFGPFTTSLRQCHAITVTGPESAPANERMFYSAIPADVGQEFHWTVTAGIIESGQGTAEIVVMGVTTSSVKVTAENPGCNNLVFKLTTIGEHSIAKHVDEYGNVRFNDEKARLDNFAIELQNDPTSQGYLICYGGRRSRAGEAQRRCDRAKDYLVNTRGIDSSRVVTVDGGLKEELTVQLWVVPAGADKPVPSPSFKPSDVKQTQRSLRHSSRRGGRKP